MLLSHFVGANLDEKLECKESAQKMTINSLSKAISDPIKLKLCSPSSKLGLLTVIYRIIQ